jgi:hypothetical protein
LEKRKWTRPQLLVLTRGKPEEMVLAGCKLVDSGADPDADNLGCLMLGCAIECADLTGS